MKSHLAIALLPLLLASCSSKCPQPFDAGSIVTHKLSKKKYLVLDPPKHVNIEGQCVVQARGEDGRLINFLVEEFTQ